MKSSNSAAMMRLALPVSLLCLLSPLISAASNSQRPLKQEAPPPLYTATIHHLPSSPTASPAPLATLAYHPQYPELSHIGSFSPPKNTTDALATTQVAIYFPNNDPTSQVSRTSATATNSFYAPYRGRFIIMIDPADGAVLSASWRASRRSDEGKIGKRQGDFDIVTRKQAPVVVFDAPAKGKGASARTADQGTQQGSDGEEEVVEKTFLQKYWWLLIAVAVLAMSGGGGEK